MVYAAVFSPDGRCIATSGEQGVIDVWDARTFQFHVRLPGHFGDCNALAFTPDGRLLVSCGDDWMVRVWDVAAGRQAGLPLFGHRHAIEKVAVSPDGRLIASASADGSGDRPCVSAL